MEFWLARTTLPIFASICGFFSLFLCLHAINNSSGKNTASHKILQYCSVSTCCWHGQCVRRAFVWSWNVSLRWDFFYIGDRTRIGPPSSAYPLPALKNTDDELEIISLSWGKKYCKRHSGLTYSAVARLSIVSKRSMWRCWASCVCVFCTLDYMHGKLDRTTSGASLSTISRFITIAGLSLLFSCASARAL